MKELVGSWWLPREVLAAEKGRAFTVEYTPEVSLPKPFGQVRAGAPVTEQRE
jgi:hypothetical protein